MNKTIFIDRVLEEMGKKDMSQTDLAYLCDVHPPAICTMLHGRNMPSAKTLMRLAQALDLSIDYLVGLTDTRRRLD